MRWQTACRGVATRPPWERGSQWWRSTLGPSIMGRPQRGQGPSAVSAAALEAACLDPCVGFRRSFTTAQSAGGGRRKQLAQGAGARHNRAMAAKPRKLLCDEMLARLARWLRAAGYDTALAPAGRDDAELLAHTRAEGRLAITCDREMARRRAGRGRVVVLSAAAFDDQVREVSERLDIDWLLAPFSRCLVDNAPVRPATDAEVARLPWQGLGVHAPITVCPACGRLFWNGGHIRRMRARLEQWAALRTAAGQRPH